MSGFDGLGIGVQVETAFWMAAIVNNNVVKSKSVSSIEIVLISVSLRRGSVRFS